MYYKTIRVTIYEGQIIHSKPFKCHLNGKCLVLGDAESDENEFECNLENSLKNRGFCPSVVIFHFLEDCANEGSRKQLLDALLLWLFNSYIFFKQEDFFK